MTTDPTPLQERIARALAIEADEQEDGSIVWGDPEDIAAAFEEEVETWERFATAVLPLIAAEVRKAQADAWDEACEASAWALQEGPRSAAVRYVAEHNPYREQED